MLRPRYDADVFVICSGCIVLFCNLLIFFHYFSSLVLNGANGGKLCNYDNRAFNMATCSSLCHQSTYRKFHTPSAQFHAPLAGYKRRVRSCRQQPAGKSMRVWYGLRRRIPARFTAAFHLHPNCLPSNKVSVFRYTLWA